MKHETKDNSLSASPAVEDLRTKGIWWIDRASNDSELIITSGAGNIAIASLYSQPMDEETKANAAYIVNAVNQHEQLKGFEEGYHRLWNEKIKERERANKLAASNLELREALKALKIDAEQSLSKTDRLKRFNNWQHLINNSKGAE